MIRNILFLSHSSELNGAELMLLQTIEKLDRSKFCPFLVIPYSGPLGDEAGNAGVDVEAVPMKWWLTEKRKIWIQPVSWIWNVRSILRISRLIGHWKIDLVFSNSLASFSGAFAAKFRKRPHIWSVHELPGGKHAVIRFFFGGRALVKLVSCLSAAVIVNSRAVQKFFPSQKKVHLVYNGIEADREIPVPGSTMRESLGLRRDDFVLGIVGKIYKEKGQREVLLATGLIARKYPHLKLLVVGEVRNKWYNRKLQKLVHRHGLESRVVFTGFRKDILDVLNVLDLLVIASIVETFGRTAIEAMAVGTPVLAVRAGGIPEIIAHGQNGFLAESRDPKVLAQAIAEILEKPEKGAKAAEEGLRLVRERFCLKKQVKDIENIFERSSV